MSALYASVAFYAFHDSFQFSSQICFLKGGTKCHRNTHSTHAWLTLCTQNSTNVTQYSWESRFVEFCVDGINLYVKIISLTHLGVILTQTLRYWSWVSVPLRHRPPRDWKKSICPYFSFRLISLDCFKMKLFFRNNTFLKTNTVYHNRILCKAFPKRGSLEW